MATANLIEIAKKNPVNYSLADAQKQELKFQVFTNHSLDGVNVTEKDVQKSNIKTNLPTKIFIHGWNSNVKSNWYNGFRDEYFKKGDYNIIYVDWYVPGSKEYPISTANVKPVGHFIGEFIAAAKVDLDKTHVIGKSLGAHVTSWAGKRVQELTGKKLGRITGLDPASPKFEDDRVSESDRLNKNDANFVDIVHTDIEYYGFKKPLGTVDFYPNGGDIQPGCGSDEAGHNDSHGRSNAYFLESINFPHAKAVKSNSWEDFLKGNFTAKESIIFGENIPMSAHGIYYFKTNAEKPYLIA